MNDLTTIRIQIDNQTGGCWIDDVLDIGSGQLRDLTDAVINGTGLQFSAYTVKNELQTYVFGPDLVKRMFVQMVD